MDVNYGKDKIVLVGIIKEIIVIVINNSEEDITEGTRVITKDVIKL